MRRLHVIVGLAACGFLSGCMLETEEAPAEGSDPEASEVLDASQEALVTGNWAGPYSNGDAGPNPMMVKQSNGATVAICEVSQTDGRYHPGKLYAGKCRYEYGSTVHYSPIYYVLQRSPAFYYIQNTGITPNNAVGSTPGRGIPSSLPVCITDGGSGKVFEGTCRIEFGGKLLKLWTFKFLAT